MAFDPMQMAFAARRALAICTTALACVAIVMAPAFGEDRDWPTWRHDPRRSGATTHELSDAMHLQWSRKLPPMSPAWPDQPKMPFDWQYEPVVAGGLLYVASSSQDTVTAYRTTSGELAWQYHANGPVRFPPSVAAGRLFFACDDGYLYCLASQTGRLMWRFRGGPADRMILGNERLISTWPARGAPVVADGVVYFAAGIFPFMGTFIHALDAETGQSVWTNDGDGSMYIKQPHNADAFAGVAPQGSLALVGEHLLIPSGRSVPACYDRATGKMVHFLLNENSKRGGGSQIATAGDIFFNGGCAYERSTGKFLAPFPGVVTGNAKWLFRYDTELQALDLATSVIETVSGQGRRGIPEVRRKWNIAQAASLAAPGGRDLIMAGSRLYGCGVGEIVAVDIQRDDDGSLSLASNWQRPIDGDPLRLLAADDRLFAVTREGTIHCFGPRRVAQPRSFVPPQRTPSQPGGSDKTLVHAVKQAAATRGGYCVIWGARGREQILPLLEQTPLRVVVVEEDPRRADALRSELAAAGWYGRRASVLVASFQSVDLPNYLATVMVADTSFFSDREVDTDRLAAAYQTLRPYGGVMLLDSHEVDLATLEHAVRTASLEGAQLRRQGEWLLLSREGPLRGAANWTHENADASNTRVSHDTRVKAPLGIHWFGGPSNDGILPRHGHGPQPQVIDGRVIIEGVDVLRACDAYTGRLMWERSLPGVGRLFDVTGHQPGANGTGTNFISTADGIYVAYFDRCLRLDPDSGTTMSEFHLPASGDTSASHWGYINVMGEYLIAGADPLVVATPAGEGRRQPPNESYSASRRLVVMDRSTGKVHWTAEAKHRFRHNAVCAGGGKLFAIDRLSDGERLWRMRRGLDANPGGRVLAFDLASGAALWSVDEDVFGTWLSYSPVHDVLIESGRVSRDSLGDEPRGMRAFAGADGDVLWKADYAGPAVLHGDRILLADGACELLTGTPSQRNDPVTGQSVPWTWTRTYGCNTPMASEHLMTFRSGAAGYFDLAGDGGTGNFGGFRSGCSNNLVVAAGLLNAPDYTRTCTCSYQNQTSVALIHMPQAEMWTQFPLHEGPGLQSLAVNLGAPGCRRAADGRLWQNDSQRVKVTIDGDGYYTGHSAKIAGAGHAWVAASGCRGLGRLEIDPNFRRPLDEPHSYTVRLTFCDPDNATPGHRVFDVIIQGQKVVAAFDPVRESGGRWRGVVKEFREIAVRDKLVVELQPAVDDASLPEASPVLSGIEVVRENPVSRAAP